MRLGLIASAALHLAFFFTLVVLDINIDPFISSTPISILAIENDLGEETAAPVTEPIRKVDKAMNALSKSDSSETDRLTEEVASSDKINPSDRKFDGDGLSSTTEYESNYGERLRALIQKNLNYPEMAKIRGLQGTVEIEILISSDGELITVVVMKTSGHQTLDQAALNSTKKIRTFEKFGNNIPAKQWRFKLPVAFILE
jgi:TonB family protein